MNKVEDKYHQLIKSIKSYSSDIKIERIRLAFDFAKLAHGKEKRLSGDPTIIHSLNTALLLASWKMDEDTIVSGILHDTVEHGAANKNDILQNFGDEIWNLVDGVTKVSKLKLVGSSEANFVENLRKMFLAIAQDLRVVFLRLAERLDNLRTLDFLPEDRRKRFAIDSLEIYGPLAERLGMWEVKNEIDDLAFKYAFPDEFTNIKNISSKYYKDVDKRISEMKKSLHKEFEEHKLKAEIQARTKGLFSLWKKIQKPEINWDIGRINDFIALRVLTENINDCYKVLGILHSLYRPVNGLAISDFIAVPKPNGYRSIHTKVFGPQKKIVEVQIRTFKMHEEAEHGLSAHWAYSEAKTKGVSDLVLTKKGVFAPKDKLSWIKQLADWQKEITNTEEFLRAVKFDALSRRIFVFSPKGDVYDLPEGSTPVDFAYAVHTGLGGYLKNVTVDGKIVPLDYKLQNGQVIEVSKSKTPNPPKHNWLDFVVSNLARREIKKHLRKQGQKDILN